MKVKINILLFMVAAIFIVFFSSKAEAVTYTVTDLGILETEDYECSFEAMNDSAQLVGYYNDHAYIWEDGSWTTDLGVLPGTDFSCANAINNSSVVVGTSDNTDRVDMFLWDPETESMTALGRLPNGKNMNIANDVNNSDQVVGSAMAENGWDHAFLWENDVLTDLDPYLFENTIMSWASAINDSGYIVGGAYNQDLNQTSAFRWKSGEGLVDLGSLGGSGASARDINDSGYIIGDSKDGTGVYHGFIWYDGVMTDLGSFGGYSTAIDINNSNEVIGVSTTDLEEYVSFIWDSTNGMRNLLDLLEPDSGIIYLNLTAINNNGQILASGPIDIEGEVEEHGFLLTPDYNGAVPEPTSLLLLGLGSIVIPFFKKQKRG